MAKKIYFVDATAHKINGNTFNFQTLIYNGPDKIPSTKRSIIH